MTATLILLFVIPAAANTVSAEPSLYRHHIVMIQGDDPKTGEIEPESQILVIERFGYLVPWNESVIDSPVPKGSISMNIDQVSWSETVGYYPGEYSAYWNPSNPPYTEFLDMEVMECCVANSLVWGFPERADRNVSLFTQIDTDSEFIQNFDDVISDNVWNFSSAGLSLKNGSDSGDYISTISPVNSINITTFEMSWIVDSHEENLTFAISNNNGTDWIDATEMKDEVVNFTSQGNELIWQVNMSQDPSVNNTPVLSTLSINLTYVPWNTEIILQLSYILEKDPNTKQFEFVMDLNKDYSDIVNPHVVVYINKDHEIVSDSLPLTLFETQTEYPDKDAYVFMSGGYSPEVAMTIHETAKEEDEFPISLLLLFVLILFIVGIILFMILGKREGAASPESEEPADSEEMEELRYKKEGLLLAMKKLDSDYEEGSLDEDTYSDLRASYKAKAVDITKEMDALAIAAAQPAVPQITEEEKALLAKKERLLKSIKKLDSDYEEGVLDEDVYKDLRQSYKEKTIEVTKEIEQGK